MLITALETQLQGSAHHYLMCGRQPHPPVDLTLGLAPKMMTAPDTTKFLLKMREHTKWAQSWDLPIEGS